MDEEKEAPPAKNPDAERADRLAEGVRWEWDPGQHIGCLGCSTFFGLLVVVMLISLVVSYCGRGPLVP